MGLKSRVNTPKGYVGLHHSTTMASLVMIPAVDTGSEEIPLKLETTVRNGSKSTLLVAVLPTLMRLQPFELHKWSGYVNFGSQV